LENRAIILANQINFAMFLLMILLSLLNAIMRNIEHGSIGMGSIRMLFVPGMTDCPEGQSIFQGFTDMQNLQLTTGITYRHRCAIVYNPDLYTEERARFIETVVTNRPNPVFRMFTNKRDAMKWLKECK
jgi:hypothetical protein